MIVNALLSILGPPLTAAQVVRLHRVGITDWVTRNRRNGRLLIDTLGDSAGLQMVNTRLTEIGRDPLVIGVWRRNGAVVGGYALNLQRWLDVAQDRVDGTDPENPVLVRPTEWVEINSWQGWMPKQG